MCTKGSNRFLFFAILFIYIFIVRQWHTPPVVELEQSWRMGTRLYIVWGSKMHDFFDKKYSKFLHTFYGQFLSASKDSVLPIIRLWANENFWKFPLIPNLIVGKTESNWHKNDLKLSILAWERSRKINFWVRSQFFTIYCWFTHGTGTIKFQT